MSLRTEKVNSNIRSLIDDILRTEVSVKIGVFITVTKVDTSQDLRYCRISFSVYPEHERSYAQSTLSKERGHIQKHLHKKLHQKILPKIEFVYDPTESKADEVERILRSIKNDKEQ